MKNLRVLVCGLSLAFTAALVGVGATDPRVVFAEDSTGIASIAFGGAGAREAAASRLESIASAAGALGVYYDARVSQYVVVLPQADAASITLPTISDLDLDVRTETRDISRATVDKIESSLEALHSTLTKFTYGFSFDPASAKVVLQSEAPESAFAEIEREFPGRIEFHPGAFFLASQSNDPQPHSGGANINGSVYCTSGFALQSNSSGSVYMVTAGHCFPNGETTNMGTVSRDSQAYPYWDSELIYGHSYRGYVYDSANYTRPVVNAWNPSVGSQYCTTGRTSGTPCDWTVRSLNVTICYTQGYPSGACAHNLAGFNRPSGAPVQPGDSGGPLWFSYSSPLRAGIRGVVSGYFFDVFTLNWMSYATQYQTNADWYYAHAVLG